GFLVAAPLTLPVAELAKLGPRGAGIDYTFATSWAWSKGNMLSVLVLPRAFGMGEGYKGPLNLWENTAYLGAVAMGLAAAAAYRRRGLWLFLALAVLGIALGFGSQTPLGLHRLLFHYLPGFGSFRNPTRAAMVSSICVAMLAAEGLAELRRDARAARRTAICLG